MASLNQIFEWFARGMFPSQSQFRDTWSSFWHKSERLPVTQIFGLQDSLEAKADKSDVENLEKNRKGYFATDAELIAAYPGPAAGNYAYVGSTGTIWTESNGIWADSGDPIPDDVDFTRYAQNGGSTKTLQDIDYNLQSVISETGTISSIKGGKGSTLNMNYSFIYDSAIGLHSEHILRINVNYRTGGIGGLVVLEKISDTSLRVTDEYSQAVNAGINSFVINKAYDNDIYLGFSKGSTAIPETTNTGEKNLYLYRDQGTGKGAVFNLEEGEALGISPDFDIIYTTGTMDLKAMKTGVELAENVYEDINADYLEEDTAVSSFDWAAIGSENTKTFTNYLLTREQVSPINGVVTKIRFYSSSANVTGLKLAIVENIGGTLTTLQEYAPTGYEVSRNGEKSYFEITGISVRINAGQNLAVYASGISYFTEQQGGITASGAYYSSNKWNLSPSNKGVLMDFYVSTWEGIKDLVSQMKSKLDQIPVPAQVRELRYRRTHSIPLTAEWTRTGWTLNGNTASTTGSDIMICRTPFRSDRRLMRTVLIFSDDSVVLLGGSVSAYNENAIDSSFIIDVPGKKLKIQQRGVLYDLSKVRREAVIPFDIVAGREYFVEIGRVYKTNSIRLSDTITGETAYLEDDWSDTAYASGSGNIRPYYFFRLQGGSGVTVRNGLEVSLPDNPFIVFGGDSNTESNGRVPGYGWAENLLINTFGSDGAIVAQSGATTNDLIVSLQNEVLAIKPGYFVCMIGTNGGGTQAQYDQIVSLCDEDGIELILCHIPTTNDIGPEINGRIAGTGVQTVRHDLATALGNDPARGPDPALFAADLIHMNQAGHDAMAERFLVDMSNLRYK